ncbi:hypothetical protein CsSME_00031533 [Camellia sinensis var. sinensis]
MGGSWSCCLAPNCIWQRLQRPSLLSLSQICSGFLSTTAHNARSRQRYW